MHYMRQSRKLYNVDSKDTNVVNIFSPNNIAPTSIKEKSLRYYNEKQNKDINNRNF